MSRDEPVGRVRVRNSHGTPISFHLEPWGDEWAMPAKAVFDVVAHGAGTGAFEVEVGVADVAVWLWSGATAEVFQDGTLVASREYPVPPGVDVVRKMFFPPGHPRSDEPDE